MGECIQISCTLIIPSFCIGYLTPLLSVKSVYDGWCILLGMSVWFLQTFLTIGSFKWLKKRFSQEETSNIAAKTIVVSVLVAYLFWYVGRYCGSRGVPV